MILSTNFLVGGPTSREVNIAIGKLIDHAFKNLPEYSFIHASINVSNNKCHKQTHPKPHN